MLVTNIQRFCMHDGPGGAHHDIPSGLPAPLSLVPQSGNPVAASGAFVFTGTLYLLRGMCRRLSDKIPDHTA